MTHRRGLVIGAVGLVLSAGTLHSQSWSHYRDYQLGGSLPSIAALAGVAAAGAKTIHLRPAMMQELQWQRPYSVSSITPAQTDPVKQIAFSLYNDQLSKMVIDYDRDRTAGMTDADLINALSTEYGPTLKPGARMSRGAASLAELESGTPMARWGDADYSVVLYRSSYASGFRLIVTSTRLETLARTADTEALRLDQRDAPRLEIARQKKEADEAKASDEKARVTNKAAFRP